MKKYAFILSVLMGCQSIAQAQSISAKNVEKHISFLASDELKGRGTGTKDEQKAAEQKAAEATAPADQASQCILMAMMAHVASCHVASRASGGGGWVWCSVNIRFLRPTGAQVAQGCFAPNKPVPMSILVRGTRPQRQCKAGAVRYRISPVLPGHNSTTRTH